MKYELILKYTDDTHEPYAIKYRCVVDEKEYARVRKLYEEYVKAHEGNGLYYVIFEHKLNEDGSYGEEIDYGK